MNESLIPNKTIINNGNNKKNTINSAIKTLLSSGTANFNLDHIKKLINSGAKICVEDDFNTFEITLYYSQYHIKKSPQTYIANQNIIDLIKFLLFETERKINPAPVLDLCINYTLTYINVIISKKCKSFDPFELLNLLLEMNIFVSLCDTNGILSQTINNACNTIHLSKVEYTEYIFGLIKLLTNSGISVTNDKYILSSAIDYFTKAVSNSNLLVEDKNLQLIIYLIENGAKPWHNQNYTHGANTLSRAIMSKNNKIINMIIGLNSLPDNDRDSCTLNEAISTNESLLVSIALNCDAKPYDNTLNLAIKNGNLDIIRLIIIHGGKPNNSDNQLNTLNVFYEKYILCDNINIEYTDKILDLIMCSGAKFPRKLVQAINDDSKNIKKCYEHFHFLECMQIYEPLLILDRGISILGDVQKIKKHLSDTMNELVNNRFDRNQVIHQIENTIRCVIKSMPTECIMIIYEYQTITPKIKYIDWLEQSVDIHPKHDAFYSYVNLI